MKKQTFFINMMLVFTIHFSGKTVNAGVACQWSFKYSLNDNFNFIFVYK